MKAKKGGSFERKIAKQLSEWWVPGRSDIFWRSSQSGGRATQRRKKGLGTYGSYGDLTAVDPIGEPLLKLFTIELKRGSSHSIPGDLIDCSTDLKSHRFAKALRQAARSAMHAKSKYWMLICRRDHRCEMVYIPSSFISVISHGWFNQIDQSLIDAPYTRCKLKLGEWKLDFVGIPLARFLACVPPKVIKGIALSLP